jgi:hypothetical protein
LRTELKLGLLKDLDAFEREQERLGELGSLADHPTTPPAERAAAREALLATIRRIRRR